MMTEQEAAALADEIEATVDAKVAAALGPLQATLIELGGLVGKLQGENKALRDRIEAVAKEPRVVIEQPAILVPPAPPANVFVPDPKPAPPRKLRKFQITGADGQTRTIEEVE